MKKQDTDSRRWKPTAKELILMSIETLSGVAQIVLCTIFYNFLELNWLLYLGWAVFAVAMVLAWRARVALEKKDVAGEGESWLHTKRLVTTGIYAVVRHPMYLSFLLISLALVFLSQHWLNAVLGVILMGLLYNDMGREEKNNIEKFGDDYLHYMKQVPRMNLVAGVVRLIRRRKKKGGGVYRLVGTSSDEQEARREKREGTPS